MPKSRIARRPLPPQSDLLLWFRYDPETGKIYNRTNRVNANEGEEAGCQSKRNGYQYAGLQRQLYAIPRIIWKMLYGTDPERDIKHIDGDKGNNRQSNLRLADPPSQHAPTETGKTTSLPTREYLRELFDYNEETGALMWKKKTGPRSVIGKEVGIIGDRGYRTTRLNGKSYKVHRLIWVWMTGEHPGTDIDHVDGCCSNNAWHNLRKVEHHVNNKNAKLAKNNKSGHSGIYWNKATRRWIATIGDKMHNRRLGSFPTLEEAVAARKAAEAELGYHENHGRTG